VLIDLTQDHGVDFVSGFVSVSCNPGSVARWTIFANESVPFQLGATKASAFAFAEDANNGSHGPIRKHHRSADSTQRLRRRRRSIRRRSTCRFPGTSAVRGPGKPRAPELRCLRWRCRAAQPLGRVEKQSAGSSSRCHCWMEGLEGLEGSLAAKFEAVLPHPGERQRWLSAGAAARGLGHGDPGGGAGGREARRARRVAELGRGGSAGPGPQAGWGCISGGTCRTAAGMFC